MKKSLKYLLVLFAILTIIIIPLIINILFKYDFNIWWLQSEWTAGEALCFYSGILSFAGTMFLGVITIWQTKNANSLSKRIVEKDLMESTDFIQLQNRVEVSIKCNDDTKIIMSSYHKHDHGANILIESHDNGIVKYNEYLIKLFFSNSSNKNHIKKIQLDHFMCVQDPSECSMSWEDCSNDPIPLGLEIYCIKDVYLNWISSNEFYAQFKIYCEPNQMFDYMMNNKADLCFLFQFNIYSFSNVKTEILYKIWLKKIKNKNYEVINTNSTIIDNKIIESKE